MRKLALLLFAIALAAPAGATAKAATGRWIVVLEEGSAGPAEVAKRHARRHGASVRFVYGWALAGYAAAIAVERVDDVRRYPMV